MKTVFVDTVAWIALVNLHDSLHESAKKIFAKLRSEGCRFLTSEFVLVEFGNALSSPAFRQKASIFVDGLISSAHVAIVPATSELFSAGFALYKNRPDKEWSLVDCTSFVLMDEYTIVEAFTEDHHFTQANFTKLL